MDKDSELLDKVTIFLIILVSAILVFSQYQFYKLLSNNYLTYLSMLLILGLVGLIAWLFISKTEKEALHHHEQVHESKPMAFMEKISYGMVVLVAILIVFNQAQISQASALLGHKSLLSDKLIFKSSSSTTRVLTGDPTKDALSLIPRGKRFYSDALGGVTFDDPIKSLEVIAQLDPAYGRNKIQLTPEEKARYIKIGTIPTMGCEFCCGANTAVTKDGRPTCGCKHSWATRGLLAFLVKNYPKLSDDEIMHSLAEWKVIFFPKPMLQRYIKEAQTGQYTPDIRALLLEVGQSSKDIAPVAANNQQTSNEIPATLENLPSQAGGC